MKRRDVLKAGAALLAAPGLAEAITQAQKQAVLDSIANTKALVDALPVDAPLPPAILQPSIANFVATPSTVTAGQSIVLSATLTNVVSTALNGQAVTLPYTTVPTVSGTYTLVATGVAGSTPASASLNVVVNPVVIGSGNLIPVVGAALASKQFNRGPADWIDPTAFPAAVAWSIYSDAANHILAPSQNGIRPSVYKKLHVWGNTCDLYGTIPLLRNGRQEQFNPAVGDDILNNVLPRFAAHPPLTGGARGVSLQDPYTTWHGHPTVVGNLQAPLYIGIRVDGMISYLYADGSIVDGGIVPGTKGPLDFSFYVPNRAYLFVADTFNGRILKVDRTAAMAALVPGQVENSALWVTSIFATGFVKPTSVRCLDDGTMFVCDATAGQLIKITTAGARSVVLSLAGLFFCDYTSTGQLALVTNQSGVYLFDPVSSVISANLMPVGLRNSEGFLTVSVDRAGTFGPVDEFLVIASHGGAGNTDMWQFRNGGTTMVANPIPWGNGHATVGETLACGDATGHYPWAASYHPDQGVLLTQGDANSTPSLFRSTLATDAAEDSYDGVLFYRGMQILQLGTTAGYQATTGKTYPRPSFTALMNENGWSLFGCSCDYIASMTYAQAAAFVQGGMIGKTPRPEIVGYDLLAVLYFIYRSSQRFVKEGATLITGLRNFIGSVAATTSPIVNPSPSSDIFMRATMAGSNVVVGFEDYYGYSKIPAAGTTVQIVIDEGQSSEWRSAFIASPFNVPKPTLAAGQHVTTCYTATPGYYSAAQVI